MFMVGVKYFCHRTSLKVRKKLHKVIGWNVLDEQMMNSIWELSYIERLHPADVAGSQIFSKISNFQIAVKTFFLIRFQFFLIIIISPLSDTFIFLLLFYIRQDWCALRVPYIWSNSAKIPLWRLHHPTIGPKGPPMPCGVNNYNLTPTVTNL